MRRGKGDVEEGVGADEKWEERRKEGMVVDLMRFFLGRREGSGR